MAIHRSTSLHVTVFVTEVTNRHWQCRFHLSIVCLFICNDLWLFCKGYASLLAVKWITQGEYKRKLASDISNSFASKTDERGLLWNYALTYTVSLLEDVNLFNKATYTIINCFLLFLWLSAYLRSLTFNKHKIFIFTQSVEQKQNKFFLHLKCRSPFILQCYGTILKLNYFKLLAVGDSFNKIDVLDVANYSNRKKLRE